MKRKYVPDLTKHISVCELNYARLNRLMPDLESCDSRRFQVSFGEHVSNIEISVEERFTYTTTVNIQSSREEGSKWLQSPALLVRLYHDANMAEVICPTSRKQLSGLYLYPNRNMHQPDEKVQLNVYLAEWLNHCLEHGHQQETIFPNL